MGFAERYRTAVGGTSSKRQLYFGLTLFFAGALATISALVIIASGDLMVQDTADRRELAGVIGGIGIPFFFLGLQLTLPSRLLIHLVAAAGAATLVVATFLFLSYYPQEWNQAGADRSTDVVAVVVVGFVLLVTTTAMALVLNFVSRFVVLPGRERDDIFDDPDRPVSIDEVMADIEREVAKQGLTWGGMSKAEVQTELVKIKADFGAGAFISPKGRAGRIVEFADTGGEDAYKALLQMRGRGRGTKQEDDETADAVSALLALRREAQAARERSWWYRFKRWLVSLFIGERPEGGLARDNTKPGQGAGGQKQAPGGGGKGAGGQRPERTAGEVRPAESSSSASSSVRQSTARHRATEQQN